MTKPETTAFGEMQTQSAPFGQELQTEPPTTKEIATNSYPGVGSVPSGLPEAIDGGQEGYVFRVGNAQPDGTVTITINTKRLIERAEVRKLNQSIRRAGRR